MNAPLLIEKVLHLETILGKRWSHTIIEPFTFDASDIIEVQRAAKKIADHIKLPPHDYIVSYKGLGENTAGNIETGRNSPVFIEIDEKYKDDAEIVLAILAHELCHKYLQINNLKLFPDYENEILTDVATVYTGLGKLSLNGCEKIKSSYSSTEWLRVGYLDRNQFAFVYLLICSMRRVPEHGLIFGLSPEVIRTIETTKVLYGEYFDENYFYNDFVSKKVSEFWKNKATDYQKHLARFGKHIKVFEECVLKIAKEQNKELHHYLKSKWHFFDVRTKEHQIKEEKSYLRNILTVESLKETENELGKKYAEIKNTDSSLSVLIDHLSNQYSQIQSYYKSKEILRFSCPACNNGMRIPENAVAKVKCSGCSYQFIIDTGSAEIIEIDKGTLKQRTNEANKKGEVSKAKRIFWSKVKGLFK